MEKSPIVFHVPAEFSLQVSGSNDEGMLFVIVGDGADESACKEFARELAAAAARLAKGGV